MFSWFKRALRWLLRPKIAEHGCVPGGTDPPPPGGWVLIERRNPTTEELLLPLPQGRSHEELVDFILGAIEDDVRLDALVAYTSMEFHIPAGWAVLAWDRVQEGIERVQKGTATPDRESDPVAWISFHREMNKRSEQKN